MKYLLITFAIIMLILYGLEYLSEHENKRDQADKWYKEHVDRAQRESDSLLYGSNGYYSKDSIWSIYPLTRDTVYNLPDSLAYGTYRKEKWQRAIVDDQKQTIILRDSIYYIRLNTKK